MAPLCAPAVVTLAPTDLQNPNPLQVSDYFYSQFINLSLLACGTMNG